MPPPGVSTTPDANAIPVDNCAYPINQHTAQRPTFHVSRDMLVFLGGVGVTLGIMWLVAQLNEKKRSH